MKIPHVSQELLDYLNVIFPNKVPNPKDTERAIWMAVGARAVVEHLRSHHEDQMKRALENKVTSRS